MIIASFYAIVLFADIQVFQLPAKVYCYPQEFIKSLTSRPGAGQAQARLFARLTPCLFLAPFFSPASTAALAAPSPKFSPNSHKLK